MKSFEEIIKMAGSMTVTGSYAIKLWANKFELIARNPRDLDLVVRTECTNAHSMVRFLHERLTGEKPAPDAYVPGASHYHSNGDGIEVDVMAGKMGYHGHIFVLNDDIPVVHPRFILRGKNTQIAMAADDQLVTYQEDQELLERILDRMSEDDRNLDDGLSFVRPGRLEIRRESLLPSSGEKRGLREDDEKEEEVSSPTPPKLVRRNLFG